MSEFLVQALLVRAKYLSVPGSINEAWEAFLAEEFEQLAATIEQLENADAEESQALFDECREKF